MATSRYALLVGFVFCILTGIVEADASSAPKPLLKSDQPVEWWFVFKFNAASFPGCDGAERQCIFGGSTRKYSFGQQFVYASSDISKLQKGSGCVGDSVNDPIGATFDEIYNGSYYYVIWNDQFYRDPVLACEGKTSNQCGIPWGHSKGMLAWNDNGEGLVMQVSTPSWPAAGSKNFSRKHDGNTLGCVKDNNVLVSQHFFALALSKDDVVKVLKALANASVVTDPTKHQIVKNGGPEEIRKLAAQLGKKSKSKDYTNDELSSGVTLISKPSALMVPPWQMVSALRDGEALRAATWWSKPQIPDTTASTKISCWDASLTKPGAVEIVKGGHWENRAINLKGGSGGNHGKLGVSASDGTHDVIFGDLNQQGTIKPVAKAKCASSQNARGGLFFVLDDEELFNSVDELLSPAH